MFFYVLKRLALAAVTLLVILFCSYVLLRLAPGDPARSSMLGGDAATAGTVSDKGGELSVNQSIREKLFLDKPIWYGFYRWSSNVILRGDFGESAAVEPGRPVTELIRSRLGLTVTLNFAAILLTYIVAVPLGVWQASRAGSCGDRLAEFAVFALYSLPVMWVALLVQSLFCEGGVFPVFPLRGLVIADHPEMSVWELNWELVKSYTLPVLCLAYGGIAGLSRYARNSMLEALRGEWIRTARAKGLSEWDIIWGHGFRNGLIPLITLFSGLLPGLITGSVLVEYVFNLPGMGSLSLYALSSRDYPLQMALFAFSGGLTLLGLLLADLAYVLADPRIKFK